MSASADRKHSFPIGAVSGVQSVNPKSNHRHSVHHDQPHMCGLGPEVSM